MLDKLSELWKKIKSRKQDESADRGRQVGEEKKKKEETAELLWHVNT